MQIFSRQAPMMDALLSYFADQMRRRREGVDGQPPEHVGPEGKYTNKYRILTISDYFDSYMVK